MGSSWGRRYGKYEVLLYEGCYCTFHSSFYEGACVITERDENEKVKSWIISSYTTKVKEISFDFKTNTISALISNEDENIFSKWEGFNDNYKQYEIKNITNKKFFDFIYNNIDLLFGHIYIIKPNEDKTKFELILKDQDPNVYD